MKLIHISDTHDIYTFDDVSPCDVLCITGDWSPLKIQRDVQGCYDWIKSSFISTLAGLLDKGVRNIVLIAGNHDFVSEDEDFEEIFAKELSTRGLSDHIHYLCNSSVTIDGVRFYGCPCSDIRGWAWWSHNDKEHYTPPMDTDIMLVHQAPDIGTVGTSITSNGHVHNFGSSILLDAIRYKTPKLLLCGHIHSGSHQPARFDGVFSSCIIVNGSILDEDYNVAYPPQAIDYEKGKGGKSRINLGSQYSFVL